MLFEFYVKRPTITKRIFIKMARVLVETSRALGDTIVTMPYLSKYTNESGNQVFVKLGNPNHSRLFVNSFPNVNFVDCDILNVDQTISLDHNWLKPIQQGFAEQLGYTNAPYIKPVVDSRKMERPIKSKYAVLSVHSTAQLKYWNHPGGNLVMRDAPNWNVLCDMLRKSGITPVVTEMHELFGSVPYFNGLPKKAVKKIGISLEDTANYIEHAEFFIGLSSGLAWLAHGLGQRVAMIANFSEDWYEGCSEDDRFVRIANRSVCNGCWNKVGLNFEFDRSDWFWCPQHKGTNRQFECHTSITPEQVFESIKKWI